MEGDFNPPNPGGTLFGSAAKHSSLVRPLLADGDLAESGRTNASVPDEAISLAFKLAAAIENIVRDSDGSRRDVRGTGIAKTLELLGLGDLGDALSISTSGAEEITARQVRDIIFTRKKRTTLQTASLGVLVWMMPFLYTIVTRLPFISLAIEVGVNRGGEYWQLAILLGSYQSCRAIANAVVAKYGGVSPIHRLHIPMVCLSIFGWVMVNDRIFTLKSDSVFWLLFLCFVGLSECILNLQTAVANETSAEYPSGIADKEVLEGRIRGQYAAVAGGAAVAFIAGGSLFQHFGFGAICWFGLACALLHLCLAVFYRSASLYRYKAPLEGGATQSSLEACYQIIALSYLIDEARSMEKDKTVHMYNRLPLNVLTSCAVRAKADKHLTRALKELHGFHARSSARGGDEDDPLLQRLAKCTLLLMDVDNDGRVAMREFVNYLGPRVYYEIHGDTSNEVDVVWPYMHFVVFTQAIVAFCIGSFLSTALLMYTQRFELSEGTSGLLLGIGEALACASIFLAYFLKKRKERRGPSESEGGVFAALNARPLHVPITVCLVSVGTICFSVPVLPVAIAAQMLMSTFNDVSVSYLNELISTSVPPGLFRKYQGRGQWLRRVGNVITGVTGPLLFGVYQGFPFLLFGGIVFVWSFVLWAAMYKQASAIERALEEKRSRGPVGPFLMTSHTPWHELEKEYYAMNRDAIMDRLGSTDAVVEDIPELKITVKRLTASLEVEKERLRAVEEELRELKSGRT